jgi:hypothetical protein
MKFTISTELCAGILIAFASADAVADSKGNPYQTISTRNAFALRAIVPKKVTQEPQPPPLPSVEIKLTGVARLSGSSPCAFLEFIDPQTKKTDRPSPFREGDRYNEHIEIVSIDASRGLVRINRDGSDVTLDFEKDGIKEGASIQPSGQPRTPVAIVPPPSGPGGRLIFNGAPTNALTVTPPVTMTHEEVLARLRTRLQQQNPSANTFPPLPAGRTP